MCKLTEDPTAAADRFKSRGRIRSIAEYGKGNINDTFLVTLDSAAENHFILQRINTRVFREPKLVMRNMRVFSEHVGKRLLHFSPGAGRRWEFPRVLPAPDGADYWIGPDGSFWRAISFIEAARSFDTVKDTAHACEVGYALGVFHNLVSDLPVENLADPLDGFHIAPRYLLRFDRVQTGSRIPKSPQLDYALRFVNERRGLAPVLEDARKQGRLRLRTIHGDPKASNVMMDVATGQSVSIVDLDTVKPGLVHYDIGDCLRSCCNPLGEDIERLKDIRFETALCRAILDGYCVHAKEFLTETDYDYLYDAIRLIAFELGLRFLTDHLEGDVYFKVRREGHNLERALIQFKLVESIEAQEAPIRAIIRNMR